MGLIREIQVNLPYKYKSICVYIADFHKFRKASSSSHIFSSYTKEIINICKDNFISLPPNVVCIDSRLLGLMIMECYNNLLGFSQAVGLLLDRLEEVSENVISDHLNSDYVEDAYSLNAINMYLRLGNIRAYKYDDRVWYSELDAVPPYIVETIQTLDVQEPYLFYFLPIVSHELAHLKYGANEIQGWFDLKEYINQISEIMQEETKADERALETVRKYLAKLNATEEPKDFYIQSLIGFTEFLRDIVLSEVYDGFRGFNAQDILVSIEQKYPMDVELQELSFSHPDRVERAFINAVPTMSKEELQGIISRLRRSTSSLTHQHLLIRGYHILEELKDELSFDPTDLYFGYYELLSGIYEWNETVDRNLLREHENDVKSTEGMGISCGDVLYHLEDLFTLREGVSFGNEDCWVAECRMGLKNKAFIEIIGPKDNIQKATLMLNFVEMHETNDEEKKWRLLAFHAGILGRFLVNLVPEWQGASEWLVEVYPEVRSHTLPTIKETIGNKLITIGTINQTWGLRVSGERLDK